MINYPSSGALLSARADDRLRPPDPPRITAVDSIGGWLHHRTGSGLLTSGWRVNGPEVDAFEREFAAHVGADFAVALSSGTAAVELALRALALPHGSRVLVSTLTSWSVVQAIGRAALRPVLVDVSEVTGMPTADHLGRVVRPGTGPARGMVLVDWAGHPSDVDVLAGAVDLPRRAVVEDVGLAVGARLEDRAVGGAGTACFSFYATSNLPIGQGGMVTTDDPDRVRLLRRTRERGFSPAARRHVLRSRLGPHVLLEGGTQASMTEQDASTGRTHLRRLRPWQRRREELAQRYDERLAGIPAVSLPHRPDLGSGAHAWQLYPVRIDRPRPEIDAVVRALATAGVGTVAPPVPLHRSSYCREVCELPDTDFRGADQLVDQLVCLPIYPRLTDSAVERVGEVLRTALR